MKQTFHTNDDGELKSVDSGNWFHTLATRSGKHSSEPAHGSFCIKFEGMIAPLRSRIISTQSNVTVVALYLTSLQYTIPAVSARCYFFFR